MKIRIGSRLFSAREDRKINQTEMAELLGVSVSTYSRLERNESSVDLVQLTKFSESLNIPIQDFLPETLSINSNHHQNGHYGVVMGNIYNYSDKELINENQKLQLKQVKRIKTKSTPTPAPSPTGKGKKVKKVLSQ
jgi:transcriptional regulator with XRE-family HTH domain